MITGLPKVDLMPNPTQLTSILLKVAFYSILKALTGLDLDALMA